MASIYLLATTHTVVRWYAFDPASSLKPPVYTTLAELDLGAVPQFSTSEEAKRAALALGLKTWTYVRLG